MKVIPLTTPFGHTIFCDDIRHEVSGKVSLIGVYAGVMLLTVDFPIVLPRLALRIHYSERPDESESPIQIKVFGPSDDPNVGPIWQAEVPRSQLQAIPKPPEPDPAIAEQLISTILHAELSPFPIAQAGIVRVRAYRDDLEVRLGSLRIQRWTLPPNVIIQAPPQQPN